MNTKTKRRHLRKIYFRKAMEFFKMDFEDTTYILTGICAILITYFLCNQGILILNGTRYKTLAYVCTVVCVAIAIGSICRFLTKEKSPLTTDNHNVGIDE